MVPDGVGMTADAAEPVNDLEALPIAIYRAVLSCCGCHGGEQLCGALARHRRCGPSRLAGRSPGGPRGPYGSVVDDHDLADQTVCDQPQRVRCPRQRYAVRHVGMNARGRQLAAEYMIVPFRPHGIVPEHGVDPQANGLGILDRQVVFASASAGETEDQDAVERCDTAHRLVEPSLPTGS